MLANKKFAVRQDALLDSTKDAKQKDTNNIIVDVGNATPETDLTFEFGAINKAIKDGSFNSLREVTF